MVVDFKTCTELNRVLRQSCRADRMNQWTMKLLPRTMFCWSGSLGWDREIDLLHRIFKIHSYVFSLWDQWFSLMFYLSIVFYCIIKTINCDIVIHINPWRHSGIWKFTAGISPESRFLIPRPTGLHAPWWHLSGRRASCPGRDDLLKKIYRCSKTREHSSLWRFQSSFWHSWQQYRAMWHLPQVLNLAWQSRSFLPQPWQGLQSSPVTGFFIFSEHLRAEASRNCCSTKQQTKTTCFGPQFGSSWFFRLGDKLRHWGFADLPSASALVHWWQSRWPTPFFWARLICWAKSRAIPGSIWQCWR